MSKRHQMKIAYVITKRGERSYWNRIGVGFVNRDGSINVKLDAVPVNGEIQLRDYVPREGSDPDAPVGGVDMDPSPDDEIPF